MARVDITFFSAGNRSREGGTMPVPRMQGMVTEAVASSASSAATTTASGDADGTGFVRILADADVWAVSGASPVAVAASTGQVQPGLRVKAGVPGDLAVAKGDRVAVINVA